MAPRSRSTKLDNSSVPDAFEAVRNDYNAAKISRYRRRRTGTLATGSHADWHYRVEAEYLRIMEQARDFDRNDCVVGQTVDRAVLNTIQGGMMLDASTGDTELDADLEARWKDWSEDPDQCDLAGEMAFVDMETAVLRATLVDGDITGVGLHDGQVELLEAHRLRTPAKTKRNVVHGILLDDNRRRQQYWFTREDVSPSNAVSLVSDMRQIDVRDAEGDRQIFHVYNPKRVSQTRGVSAFAPIFDLLGMFEDVNFATLVKRQVASCFAIFRTREQGFMGGDGASLGGTTTQPVGDGSTRTIEGIAPGMEIRGEPGEKVEGFSPTVTDQEFFNHVRLLLSLIGVNLGTPLVMVLMDASETNFSGYRGAVDQARLGYRRNQGSLIRRFHKPLYRFKVRQWLADDAALRKAAARSGVDLFAHTWTPPAWPYIEPLKDATTDLLQVRNGLNSSRRIQATRGREEKEVANEIVADNAYKIRIAKQEAAAINKEFDDGAPVHWRELLSLPTPDGVTVTIGPEGGGTEKVEAGTPKAAQNTEAA